jgi:hypothetical protein
LVIGQCVQRYRNYKARRTGRAEQKMEHLNTLMDEATVVVEGSSAATPNRPGGTPDL